MTTKHQEKKKKTVKTNSKSENNRIIVPFPKRTMLVCQDESGRTVLEIDLMYAQSGITKSISSRKEDQQETKSDEWIKDYAIWLSKEAGEVVNFTQAKNLVFAISDTIEVLKKKSLLQPKLVSSMESALKEEKKKTSILKRE